jgi:Putative addiction module component
MAVAASSLEHMGKEFEMRPELGDIQAAVLELPTEDRARLNEALLASLEPKSNAQVAWMQLADQRREDVRAGRVAMAPGDEALARIRARIERVATQS